MKLHKPGLHSWHLLLLYPHADPASTIDPTSGWVLKPPPFLSPHHQVGLCSRSLWPGLIWQPAAWPLCFHNYSLPPLFHRTVGATFTQYKYDLVIILSENHWSNDQNPQQSSGVWWGLAPPFSPGSFLALFCSPLMPEQHWPLSFPWMLPAPFYPKASVHTSLSSSLCLLLSDPASSLRNASNLLNSTTQRNLP